MINTEDNHPDLRMGKLAQELDNVIEELDNLSLETGEHANRPRYLDTLRLIGKVRTVLRTMEEIDPSHKRPETRRALERVTRQVGDLKELYKVNVRSKIKLRSDTPPGPG